MPADYEVLHIDVDPGPLGQRLCVLHRPAAGAALSGLVVHVHPFAEELNKSRHVVAKHSRELAAAGFAVLRIDLLGCGDSAGDFADATWDAWVQDVVAAAHWLLAQYRPPPPHHPPPPLWLWGLRAGCLLTAEAAGRLDAPCHLLMWQPFASGKLQLQQFLRLKLAADVLATPGSANAAATLDAVRRELSEGRPVEIAGYTFTQALTLGLAQSECAPPASVSGGRRIEWIDVAADPADGPAPAARRALAKWQEAGWATAHHLAQGAAFWQTSELEDAPGLREASLRALRPPQAPAGASAPMAEEIPA